MPDTAPRRVVVFDRIDANRRNTWILSVICGIALIPVVGWFSSYLAVWFLMLLPGLMDSMGDARAGISVYVGLTVAIAAILLVVALHLQYRYADRIALRISRARPLGRDQEKRLWGTVEALCLGIGLPLPRVHVVETDTPNAFSVGLDPGRSSLVVTRGLLALLTPHEMEGVLAHEMSLIGNQDIRLNTIVAAMGSVLRLPLRLLAAPFRFLFHLHWVVGLLALLPFVGIASVLPEWSESFRTVDEMDPGGRLRVVILAHAGVLFHVFLLAPLIGALLPLAVSRQRVLLADADAVLLTRDPPSLARALAKISRAGSGAMAGSHALGHLYIAGPGSEGRWWRGLLSVHPPVNERIELLAGMGDGLLPEDGAGRSASRGDTSASVGFTPETATVHAAMGRDREKVGLLDASLYGIAIGAAAVATLTIAAVALAYLGSAAYRPPGPTAPFNLPAALAAGFSAWKRGTAAAIALGFAVLVFMFPWLFLLPLIPFLPNPDASVLRWTVWSLAADFAVVAVAATLGASMDRWSGAVRSVFEKALQRRSG